MRMTSTLERMPEVERRREGAHGLIIDKITFQTAFFGALSNAQIIRKNKGRGRGRGSCYPGGSAEGSVTSADDYIFNITVETRNMSSLQPAKLGRDSQMPALFQMAHRMDRWQNWHRGMPAGKHGQGHQRHLRPRSD